jgi:hypothetical protein
MNFWHVRSTHVVGRRKSPVLKLVTSSSYCYSSNTLNNPPAMAPAGKIYSLHSLSWWAQWLAVLSKCSNQRTIEISAYITSTVFALEGSVLPTLRHLLLEKILPMSEIPKSALIGKIAPAVSSFT